MKSKIIIIISLIGVLVLGGTIALAATAEGQFVNPFSKVLNEKVDDGTITTDEANIFSKVWDAIRGDKADENFYKHGMMGKKPGFRKPEFDEETIAAVKVAAEEIKVAMEAKIDEVIGRLISDGYINQEDVDAFEDKPMELWWLIKDADDETQSAVKAAMVELMDYRKALIEEKIESGELTKETAGLLIGGNKPIGRCDMKTFCGEKGKFPEFENKTDDGN